MLQKAKREEASSVLISSSGGLLFYGRAEFEIAHEAVEVVGMDAEEFGGFGDASGSLVQGVQD